MFEVWIDNQIIKSIILWKKQKQIYVSPETETLVVRFEGMVCSSPGYSANGLQKGHVVDSDDFDEWDD